jgi:methionine-gamma-lyase
VRDRSNPEWRPATRFVHAGEGTDPETKAIRRPIHMANSYELPTDVEELVKTLSWENLDKFNYTREHNPTARHLEERLAELEGGEDCVVAASGMGAIAATHFSLLNAGDHIVCSEVCYTGTQKLVSTHLARFGVEVSMVDTSDLSEVAAAVRPNTKVIHMETPGNPLVVISDIAAIAEIAHKAGALLVVDSTWSGLVTQHPLKLGADLVIHSTTKYINGHGDSLGGAVIGPEEILAEIRERGIVHLGACISPFNAWLIMRGSVTLPLRMRQHCENAQKIAEFLQSHPKVKSVRYPGLPSFPEHELAMRQMSAPSAMMTFNLKAELMEHFSFIERLSVITHAVSLGHDQSLIYYLPTVFFFSDMVVMNDAQKEKYARLMGDGIFRFSVGIEDADDIIDDLKRALEEVP